MTATLEQEAPAAVSADFTARKLRLIEYIIRIEEEADLLEFEHLMLFGFSEDEEDVSEEEAAFVAGRIAEAKAHPELLIPLETAMQNIRNRR